MEEGKEVFQRRLEDKPDKEVFAHKGKPIYPEKGGTGMLQQELRALPIEKPVRGLKGFQACDSATLYYNGHFWSIRNGERFGTYAKNVSKPRSK